MLGGAARRARGLRDGVPQRGRAGGAARLLGKAAPALAAGNCMVLKPAEATPLSALAVAALGEMAGLPAGVFNVVSKL